MQGNEKKRSDKNLDFKFKPQTILVNILNCTILLVSVIPLLRNKTFGCYFNYRAGKSYK